MHSALMVEFTALQPWQESDVRYPNVSFCRILSFKFELSAPMFKHEAPFLSGLCILNIANFEDSVRLVWFAIFLWQFFMIVDETWSSLNDIKVSELVAHNYVCGLLIEHPLLVDGHLKQIPLLSRHSFCLLLLAFLAIRALAENLLIDGTSIPSIINLIH